HFFRGADVNTLFRFVRSIRQGALLLPFALVACGGAGSGATGSRSIEVGADDEIDITTAAPPAPLRIDHYEVRLGSKSVTWTESKPNPTTGQSTPTERTATMTDAQHDAILAAANAMTLEPTPQDCPPGAGTAELGVVHAGKTSSWSVGFTCHPGD